MCRIAKQDVTKVAPLVQMAEHLSCVSSPLKVYLNCAIKECLCVMYIRKGKHVSAR